MRRAFFGTGCSKGYRRGIAKIPRDSLPMIGISSKYVQHAYINATSDVYTGCGDAGSRSLQVRLVLDFKALAGIEYNKITELIVMVTDQVKYHEAPYGNITKEMKDGTYTICGILHDGYKPTLPPFITKSSIPTICRYFYYSNINAAIQDLSEMQ